MVEARGIAASASSFFRLSRVVVIARHALVGAAELIDEAGGIHDAAAAAHQIVQHRLAVDGISDGLAHPQSFSGAAPGDWARASSWRKPTRMVSAASTLRLGTVSSCLAWSASRARSSPRRRRSSFRRSGFPGRGMTRNSSLRWRAASPAGCPSSNWCFFSILTPLRGNHRRHLVGAGADGRLGEAIEPDLLEIGPWDR